MYCPKCTLEIKGDDQTTCPICSAVLVDSPVDNVDLGSDEDLKLQELIADIDGKVSGDDETPPDDVPAFEISDEIGSVPDLSLELEDKPLESSIPEPEFKLEMEATSGDDEIPVPDVSLDPDKESIEPATYESGFSLEMDDKAEGSGPADDTSAFSLEGDEPEFNIETETTDEISEPSFDLDAGSADEPSIDFKKGLSLEDDAGSEPAEPEVTENNAFDLEKELGLTDEPEKPVVKEPEPVEHVPPSIDFDRLPVTEEVQDIHESEEQIEESADIIVPYDDGSDAKDILDKTLEELDPIGEMENEKKKSSKTPLLVAVCIILLIVAGGVSYMMKKSEIDEPASQPVAVKKKEPAAPKKAVKPKAVKPAQKKPAVKQEVVKKKAPVVKKAEKKVAKPVVKPVARPAPKPLVKPAPIKEPPKPVVKRVKAPAVQTFSYSIHAGSFKKKYLAQTEINRFGKLGFNGYIERVNLGAKGVWYRVKIGLYVSRAEAKKAQKAFLKKVKAQTRVVKNK